MANSEPQLQADFSSLSPDHCSRHLNTPGTPPVLSSVIESNRSGCSRSSAARGDLSSDKENSLAHASAIFGNLNVKDRQMASIALEQHSILSPRKQNLRAFSPRKQTVENQALSFTPRRARQPPRAWERRPATPYVSRNDGQKIWKRVPLEDMGLERNSEAVESRRIREAKEDYMRAVKKLKVDKRELQECENTEREHATDFWVTKLEEDTIEKNGSPKQKGTAQLTDDWSLTQQHNAERPDSSGSSEENGSVGVIAEVVEDSALNKAQVNLEIDHLSDTNANDTSTRDTEEQDWEGNPPEPEAVPETTGLENLESISKSAEHEKTESHIDKREIDSESLVVGESDGASEHLIPETFASIDEEISGQDEQVQNESPTSGNHFEESFSGSIEPTAESRSPQSKPITFSGSVSAISEPELGSNRSSSKMISNHSDIACDDLFDLSTPTALQAPVSDERNLDTTGQTELTLEANDVATAKASTTGSQTTKPHIAFQVAEEEEDTAFLANFLLRAKASKAAREAAAPEQAADNAPSLTNASPPRSPQKDDISNTDDDDEIEDLDLPCNQSRQSTEALPQTTEVSVTSPLRRSSRNANTKVSRIQSLPPVPQFGPVLPSQNVALPNTIQLKRATGNEFIFRAKPQQTVQMMTRTNTKRNQGNAVHVDLRLQQLTSGTTSEAVTTLLGGEDNQLSSTTDISNSPSKKRKRNKDNEDRSAKKTKKNVKWQEELVSYREPTPQPEETASASDDFAAIEAAAQTEALKSTTDSFSISASGPSSQEPKVAKEDEPRNKEGDSSKLKVRKIRKVNVGNVNGTPAPKTRTRGQMDFEDHAEVPIDLPSLATKGKASSGISSSKTKVPVPTSSVSAIPLPATTTAKTNPKDKAKPASIPTTIPTTNSRAVSTANEKTESSLERKLDGRRRLRARV